MLLEVSITPLKDEYKVQVWDPENEQYVTELEGLFESTSLAFKHIENLKNNRDYIVYDKSPNP